MKTKYLSVNNTDIQDKNKFSVWSDNCLNFLKSNQYITDEIAVFEEAASNHGIKKMLGILREFIKHQDELVKASPIIKNLGLTPDYEMCSDMPDILLPSRNKREIGIEVTEYLHESKAKNYFTNIPTVWVGIGEKFDANLFQRIIAEKEKKIKKYKLLSENKSIKKYILIISIPFLEVVDISKIELPKEECISNFDQIFLVDVDKFKQLK